MRELLQEKLIRACTLTQFLDGVFDAFQEVQRKWGASSGIGYVSGIVSSDGVQNIEKNLMVLRAYTDSVCEVFNIPAFCAGDIFSYSIFERLEAQNIQYHDLVEFWHKVIGLGYITDIFMTADWVRSRGAKEEHVTAKGLGLKIHYLAPDFLITHKLIQDDCPE